MDGDAEWGRDGGEVKGEGGDGSRGRGKLGQGSCDRIEN